MVDLSNHYLWIQRKNNGSDIFIGMEIDGPVVRMRNGKLGRLYTVVMTAAQAQKLIPVDKVSWDVLQNR